MKALKIGIAVVLLAAALAITMLTGDGSEPLPDTPESNVKWRCSDCEHTYDLSSLKSAEAQTRAGATAPIHCAKCDVKAAYQVIGCPECGTLYFGSEAPGSTGQCPKCNPDASPWEPGGGFDRGDGMPENPEAAPPKPRPKNVRGPTRKECDAA